MFFSFWSGVCTRCFILKIDWMLYAVSMSDFLSGLICPVQLDVAAVQNRLDTSEAEWRATSETCCSDSGGFTAWSRMAVIN